MDYEKELRDCEEFEKVDGILDKLGIEKGPGPRWRHLHGVMGITRVFNVPGNRIALENEKDQIEYRRTRSIRPHRTDDT